MANFASAVYPVPDRFVNLGKEVSPGTIATGVYTFPLTTFKPVDKVTYLPDSAWRNAMADLYNLIQGVRIADVSLGGPFFADGMGYVLADMLGDYWQFVNGTPGSVTSINSSSAVGAGTITVASAGGYSTNTVISIGGTGTTAEEVRKVTSVTGTSPGTLTLNANLYQAHNNGSTVIAWTAIQTYGHNFALLNAGLGAGGWTASQPPTYTYVDYTGVPATSGARNYAYSCFSEVTITGEATALVMWDGKITSLASAITASTPTTTLTTVAPQAAWNTTVTLAGAGTYNTDEYKVTLTRKIGPYFTDSGQRDPFAIVRGAFGAALSLNFGPASDEAEFNYYLANSQPTLSIVSSNGLAGTAAASLTITAQVAAFDTAELDDSKDAFGFDSTVKCVANTTNAGPSGGYSPLTLTLTNGVLNY